MPQSQKHADMQPAGPSLKLFLLPLLQRDGFVIVLEKLQQLLQASRGLTYEDLPGEGLDSIQVQCPQQQLSIDFLQP